MVKHNALISIARGCTNQERVWVGKLFGEPTKLTDPVLFSQYLSITGAGLDFPLAHPMDSNPSILAQKSARHRNHSQTDSIDPKVGIAGVTDSRTAVLRIVAERAAAQQTIIIIIDRHRTLRLLTFVLNSPLRRTYRHRLALLLLP